MRGNAIKSGKIFRSLGGVAIACIDGVWRVDCMESSADSHHRKKSSLPEGGATIWSYSMKVTSSPAMAMLPGMARIWNFNSRITNFGVEEDSRLGTACTMSQLRSRGSEIPINLIV